MPQTDRQSSIKNHINSNGKNDKEFTQTIDEKFPKQELRIKCAWKIDQSKIAERFAKKTIDTDKLQKDTEPMRTSQSEK